MKAVVFGAGNIGRGFIGQLLYQSGYDIAFIDIDQTLLGLLNERRRYTIRLVERDLTVALSVTGVSGIHAQDDAAARAVAQADVAATAVGVRALPHIAGTLARGIALRDGRPLNIIVCENMRHAGDYLRERVTEQLRDTAPLAATGFVEACIGRMVPAPRPGDDPTVLRAEPYDWLPVDADAIREPAPVLRRMWPISDFDRYVRRKLYIHNMGHALCAWLGQLRGHRSIADAIADPQVADVCRAAMLEAAAALASRYLSFSGDALISHVDDLLHRFGNGALGDPVSRVGRDTERKLGPDDRVTGALTLCREQGVSCPSILTGLAAGLLFESDDPGTLRVRSLVNEEGVAGTLARVAGIRDPEITETVIERISRLRSAVG
ncbi:MAG: mannitol-1-phosphate 5-dehydrogenase [Clostridiales bacterium]|nr:mannitol-1-phosphate 5-dehydrogenase [Clostridiales bacterium]